MSEERRKFQRYLVRGSVVVVLTTGDLLPCRIIDISRNGLAFSYQGALKWGDELLQLGLQDDENFSLDKIPVRIVSDCALDESSQVRRRCGVQFGELTPDQEAQLDYFIQRHIFGTA